MAEDPALSRELQGHDLWSEPAGLHTAQGGLHELLQRVVGSLKVFKIKPRIEHDSVQMRVLEGIS